MRRSVAVSPSLLVLLLGACANPVPSQIDASGGLPDYTVIIDLNGAGADLTMTAATDAAVPVDLTAPADQAAGPDLLPPPRIPGDNCVNDGDCTSLLCKAVLPLGSKVCVVPCSSQPDCTPYLNLICVPTAPGSSGGYCVPRSPTSCGSCQANSDCGILSERCLQAPGDIARACHVDCGLAGADACPNDYNCTTIDDSGTMRQLCLPAGGVCLDALGGFCDRVSLPQPCFRSNTAGQCSGQRVCLMVQKRYDKCNAMAPQFKQSCSDQDPAGCKVQFASSVIGTAQSCGACGNTCPGLNQATADVTCVDPANKVCGFTCKGESYDVDKSAANGCERNDTDLAGHSQSTAATRPSHGCDDAEVDTFGGVILSDARVHANPTVASFNSTTGAAPDYWTVVASGGACALDYDVTFTTAGGGPTSCYRLTLVTDKLVRQIDTSGAGTVKASDTTAARYSVNSNVTFIVEKTCSIAAQGPEAVTYTVQYHL